MLTFHHKFQVRLADHAEQAEIGNTRHGPQDIHDVLARYFERLQIVAVNLDGELPLNTAHGFLHVVGDGLREIP